MVYRNRASKVDLYVHCSKSSKWDSDVSFGFRHCISWMILNCVLSPIRKTCWWQMFAMCFHYPRRYRWGAMSAGVLLPTWADWRAVEVATVSSHLSCFVVVFGGWLLGLSPYLSPTLHFPGQWWHLLGCKRDAQAPSTVGTRRAALLRGGQNMTVALCWLWKGGWACSSRCSVAAGPGAACPSVGNARSLSVLVSALSFHFPLLPSDHYMQVLACKHDCIRELATRSGRISPIENFLPLHYDYLQFAYYRGKAHLPAPYSSLCVLLGFVQVWFVSWDFRIFSPWNGNYNKEHSNAIW